MVFLFSCLFFLYFLCILTFVLFLLGFLPFFESCAGEDCGCLVH